MFNRFISLLAFVAPLASALTIAGISDNPLSGTLITVTYTSTSSDSPFTLELGNPSIFNNDLAIANNVQPGPPGTNTVNVTLPIVPATSGYTLIAIPPGNINDVLSTFGPFSIGATPSGSVSSVTTTGTGGNTATTNTLSVTTSASGSSPSTGTGTGTSNTETPNLTTSNSATGTTGTSSGSAASSSTTSAAISTRLALTNACGYAVFFLSVVGGAVAVAL